MKRDHVVASCVVALMVVANACDTRPHDDGYVRGHGVAVAHLSEVEESQVIEAAIRAAFDLQPGLTLRIHPLHLPRTAGDSGGTPVLPAIVGALRRRGLVLGSCEPIRTSPRDTPRCPGPEAGYVVRTSDVFTISPAVVELNFAAEKYAPATGAKPEALRFEKIYQLERQGRGWRVAREARARRAVTS